MTTPSGLRKWAGKAGDPFWIEPDVLHAVGHALQDGTAVNPSATGTAEDPLAYGEKVARRFCPNLLPYEVGTAAVFGFAEWNGRSLTDNTPDVMCSLATNSPVSLGIGKESVTSKPRTTFPYVPPEN